MGCCHYYAPGEGGDEAFSIDLSAIAFGKGVLREAGDHARALGIERIALVTDPGLPRASTWRSSRPRWSRPAST